MTSKFFKFDMLNNTITGSKANIQKAGIYNSPQYKELMGMKKAQPTFTVAVKAITPNTAKKTYKGLTMEAMRTHIENQPKSAEMLQEFEDLTEKASYPIVKSWFLDNYKTTYKKTETQKQMTRTKVIRLTSKGKTPTLSKVG